MEILKYEIKKLFINKIAISILIAFTVIPAMSNYINELNDNKNIGSIKEVYNLERQYEGKIDEDYFAKNADKLELIKNKEQFQIKSKEEQFYYDYFNALNNLNTYKGINNDRRFDSILSLKNELKQLKGNGKEGTYYYKNANKKYKMMIFEGEPKFFFAKGWNDFFSKTSNISKLMIGMIILLLVSPIFSNEYSSGMDSLMFSSKNGRAKIVKSKLFATIVLSISVVVFYNLVQFLSVMLPTSFTGWNTPIRDQLNFMHSPYNFTMIQYFGISIIFQTIGAIVLSFMVTMISSLSKSSLATFFISFCMYILPFIFMMLGLNKANGANSIMKLLPIKMIGNYDVFKEYGSYNILGSPILYPYVIVIVNIIVAIFFAIMTKYIISKKNAN